MTRAPLFLSASEAARQLGVHKAMILRAIATGALHAKRLGVRTRRWYILRSDLNRWAIMSNRDQRRPSETN